MGEGVHLKSKLTVDRPCMYGGVHEEVGASRVFCNARILYSKVCFVPISNAHHLTFPYRKC